MIWKLFSTILQGVDMKGKKMKAYHPPLPTVLDWLPVALDIMLALNMQWEVEE